MERPIKVYHCRGKRYEVIETRHYTTPENAQRRLLNFVRWNGHVGDTFEVANANTGEVLGLVRVRLASGGKATLDSWFSWDDFGH